MYDCYYHKCEICSNTVPMHISDFNYRRDEFTTWCHDHIENAPPGSVIFEVTELDPYEIDSEDDIYVEWKCAILGPEVEDNTNCPNLASTMMIQRIS